MKDFHKFIISVISCESIGLLGIPFTVSAIPEWYSTLNKPSFAPPNWIFGPVWTLLYFLMGVAFYLIWKQNQKKKTVKTAKLFFLTQLGLNFLWSPVFFGLKAPTLGLIIIFAMLILIGVTIKKFYPLSRLASYLLLPYLLWVSFATVLNAAIVILN